MDDTEFSNFSVYRPKMWPFIGKLLSSILLWCCLFVNFTQFVILVNLSILDLALSGMKGLTLS